MHDQSSHDVSSTSSPAQYLWTSGICRCWPDCMELFLDPRTRGIWRFLRTVTDSLWRRFYLRSTSVFSAWEVCCTKMRCINPHLTLTLTSASNSVVCSQICLLSLTRSQAVARIADRTASQHLWESRDHLILHMSFPIGGPLECSLYLKPFSRYCALSVLGSRVWPFKVTWRHWSCDHSITHMPFPIGGLWEPNLCL